MNFDIAIPKSNEKEFAEIASRLGIKKMDFLYNFEDYKKAEAELNGLKIEAEKWILANSSNLNQAFSISKNIAAKSSENDRFLIESKKIKIIFGMEEDFHKDKMHQRNSGFNHILAQLCHDNNVTIGFSYASLFNKNPGESSLILGRMSQNLKLCKKYKVKTLFGCFSSNPYDLRSRHDVGSFVKLL